MRFNSVDPGSAPEKEKLCGVRKLLEECGTTKSKWFSMVDDLYITGPQLCFTGMEFIDTTDEETDRLLGTSREQRFRIQQSQVSQFQD